MSIELNGPGHELLSRAALSFLADLEREFRLERSEILAARVGRQQELDAGVFPGFADSVARRTEWKIAPVPSQLVDRRVEITGPVDAKMMINALNSGARIFMADFEDATTPTWSNLLRGQANLVQAHRGTLRFVGEEKTYTVGDDPATLIVRPRGWHLAENHVLVDGTPMSASLFDFGLYLFHGGRVALEEGGGPFLYLPKLEGHLEARLWNQVFCFAQDRLGIGGGSVKATVLIETILAAFEMDEILFELRDHAAGLNAGRWDYIFSVIKKFRNHPHFVLPDRAQITMSVPFMNAYTEEMVAACHRHGAHAIGGMAAFIPNRYKPEVTETALAKVRADKAREAAQGCDGTWVAHPGLVPVAMAEFDAVLGDRPNQIGRLRQDVSTEPSQLIDVAIEGGRITAGGLGSNISIGLRYLSSWLEGQGAAGIDDLMEDVATAEISRCQVWQWLRHGSQLDDGTVITPELVESIIAEEATRDDVSATAVELFHRVATDPEFIDFLTLPAYKLID